MYHYYDFMFVDLFHRNNFRDEKTVESRQIAHTRSDACLGTNYWQSVIIAKVTNSLVNCDSPFDHIRQRSETVLCQEIDLAIHLSIDKILIALPPLSQCPNIDNLARIMNRYLDDVTLV